MSTTDERDGGTLENTRPVPLDGDDIVVVAEHPKRPPRRDLLIWGAGFVALLLAGGVASFAFRGQAHHTTVRTTSPSVAPSAATPKIATPKTRTVVTTPPTTATAPRATTPTTNAKLLPATTPQVTVGGGPVVTPVQSTAPPTTAAPLKQYGPSVLTWSAPRSMTVLAGSTAVLAVAAHNPTDGAVTLPHPLACTPRLDHGEICPEVVQVLAPRTSAGAQYTIDAHGMATGRYSLTIEGVLTVTVTVRAIP